MMALKLCASQIPISMFFLFLVKGKQIYIHTSINPPKYDQIEKKT